MTAQDRINALWSAASAGYGAEPRHGILDAREEGAWKSALARLLPEAPADVLDVGTGTGVIALLVVALGHRVRGVDLVEPMLEKARASAAARGLDVSFERGDAHDPPGEAASVDAVINRHLFWTLTDPPRALRNWHRLLRRDGRLVIIDGLWSAPTDDERLGDLAKSLPITQGVTLDDIARIVRDAGFSDIAFSDLAGVERVELEVHGPPEHDDKPRYVLTARKP